MKLIAIMSILVVVVGCATFDDIRQNAPTKTLFIPDSSPQKVANCAAYEMRAKYPNANLIEKEGVYFLNANIETILQTSPLAEISFKPKENGTFIELRRRAATQWQENNLWDCVVKCAGK